MAEAGNAIAAVMISAAPVPAIDAIVWTQLNHPEGDGRSRIDVAMTACAQERIYKPGEFLGRNLEG